MSNRNIKDSMTIALWEISDGTFFKPWMLRIRKVSMLPWQQKKNINNNVKHFPRNNDK